MCQDILAHILELRVGFQEAIACFSLSRFSSAAIRKAFGEQVAYHSRLIEQLRTRMLLPSMDGIEEVV